MKHLVFWLFLLGSVVETSRYAVATTTKSFQQTSAKEFEEGEATASLILPPGEVVPGMKARRIGLEAAFVWCGLRDGARAYFGTGDVGRLIELSVDGRGAPKIVAELGVPWVTALAMGAKGQILAGSTPEGRVFSISPQGKFGVLAKLPAEHVWALLYDQEHQLTFAGTGNSGKLFTIDAKGSTRLVWDSGDKHIMTLAADGSSILAGTADKAILYRVQRDGRFEALHDFDADEVRAILRVHGAIYLAVNDFEPLPEPSPTVNPKSANGTRVVTSPPVSGAQPRGDQQKVHSAVYRLEDDGRIEQVFTLADGYLTALLSDPSGHVWVASGTQGKLYQLAPDHSVALVADLPERQALSLVSSDQGFLIGTGDVGAIYRVTPAQGQEASYLSKVFDAQTSALWGQMWWSGSADLRIETRSGNTGKPDTSWSSFVALQNSRHHADEHEGTIRSQSARYFQYRVFLPQKTSILKDISVFYVPHNQRARVTEITLADPLTLSALPAGTTPLATTATRTHSDILKLRWKVENPDEDDLIYRLFYREERESIWKRLGGAEDLNKPEFDWDTGSVADGRYQFRVWTSDERVTPANRALDFTYESGLFLVDNSKPEIHGLKRTGRTIVGQAIDNRSILTAIEYSIDGGEWYPAEPDDGLLDERAENFSIALSLSLLGAPHIINVRAYDQAHNLGVARIAIHSTR